MKEAPYLILNTRDELLRVDISTIVYFEAEGNYTHIILSNRTKHTLCLNLARMQQVLSEHLQSRAAIFARVGKRHIINLSYVQIISLSRQRLILSDGHLFSFTLAVSKEALKALRQLYVNTFGDSSPVHANT